MKNFLVATLFLIAASTLALAYDVQEKYFKQFEETATISMDLKNTALVDVLRIFSKQSGMNFVADDDISDKKVTLFLENVPMDEALHRILDARQLTYTKAPNSNIFIIKAKVEGLVTRVYNLKYASVSTSKINNRATISSDISASSASSSSGTNNALSAGGLLNTLKAMLSKQGSIMEDARTNSLIITDTLRQFPTIEATLAQLDVPLVQVMIEVEMLDISKDTAQKIGAKYGNDNPILSINGGTREQVLPWNQNELERKGAFTPLNQYKAGKIDATGMQVILDFIKTRTDTKNLAKPRLMTLNNETAQIKISTDEAIGQTENEAAQSGNVSKKAERVQTGVFLSVTPQVNIETREILMSVNPKVIQARLGATFGGITYKDPEERGTQSTLLIKDGETVVLGGLLREDDSEIVTKLPILGDIPLVGGAFRHRNKSGSQRELVIFITPHIIGINKIADQALLTPPLDAAKDLRVLEVDMLLDKIEKSR